MSKLVISLMCALLISACTSTGNKGDALGYQGFKSGEESVEETLFRLRNDPAITIRANRGWTVANLAEGRILWSFTPPEHPAHPAFVKREVIEKDGSIYLNTTAKCEADKLVCDQLVRDFIELNDKVRREVNGG